jgi:hypothetical protein
LIDGHCGWHLESSEPLIKGVISKLVQMRHKLMEYTFL